MDILPGDSVNGAKNACLFLGIDLILLTYRSVIFTVVLIGEKMFFLPMNFILKRDKALI